MRQMSARVRQMRTTLNIEDGLYQRAKAASARERDTVSSLVEQGLRMVLAVREEASERPPVHLTVVGGRGPQPGIDLDDSAALLELTERSSDGAQRAPRDRI